MDPKTPVLVGVAQLNERDDGAEPIDFMTRACEAALADAAGAELPKRLESIRVVGGIWPYKDPGRIVAERLGLDGVVSTMTPIGGNEVYDLLAATADDIQNGELGAAVICAAETLRTRRSDRAAGRDSVFVEEAPDAAPDHMYGVTGREMLTDAERAAGVDSAVAFYALAETALRHANGESPSEHRARVSALWAAASEVAASNPSAWFQTARTADEIATPTPSNRPVSSPYPKLMTSNINVDQAAAVVVCSAEVAEAAGIPRDRWVFVWSGSGASDHWKITNRWSLHESPAMRLTIAKTLELAGIGLDDVTYLDLYSCFPAAVQVAQRELGIDPDRPFTITGGLTFFGGPLNSYCLHALARAVEVLRADERDATALLTGNGGFFTKHSAALVANSAADGPYRSERVQAHVDALPARPDPESSAEGGTIESYTVAYAPTGEPERAVVAVIDDRGRRVFARIDDPDTLRALLDHDLVGCPVVLEHSGDAPIAALV